MIRRCELEVNINFQGGSHQKNCTMNMKYTQMMCRVGISREEFLCSIDYIYSMKLCMIAVTPLRECGLK